MTSACEHPIYPFDIADPTRALPRDADVVPTTIVIRFGNWLEAKVDEIIAALR